MSNKTYIGLHPNNLNRTEYGQVVLYVEGEPVAFFSGSGDVIISGSLGIEGITNVSASIAAAISTDTGSFVITGSVNNDTITFTQGDGTTFDIIVNNVTSSLTASYVEVAQTASYVTLAQSASYVSLAQSASYVLNAVSASYATFTAFAEDAITASYAEYAVLSSTASLAEFALLASTASLAEFALLASTASYVENAQTASYVLNAVSSSYTDYAENAVSASYSAFAETAVTASYVLNAVSASYAVTASYVENAVTASYVENAVSASYVLNAISASYAGFAETSVTASYVLNAESASYAGFAETAVTASYVQNAESASYATFAETSVSSSYTEYAENAKTAETASSADDFLVRGDLEVRGIVTAQEFHTQFVSSSVIFSSGSTKFGDDNNDIHSFSGSVNVTQDVTAVDVNIDDWGSVSASLAALSASAGALTLQEVTDQGNETDNSVIVNNALTASLALISSSNNEALRVSSGNTSVDLVNAPPVATLTNPQGKYTYLKLQARDFGSDIDLNGTGIIFSHPGVSETVDRYSWRMNTANHGNIFTLGVNSYTDTQIQSHIRLRHDDSAGQLETRINVGDLTAATLRLLGAPGSSPAIYTSGSFYMETNTAQSGTIEKVLVQDEGSNQIKWISPSSLINASVPTSSLDSVTDNGNVTTNSITVGGVNTVGLNISNVFNAGTDTDKFLVLDSGGNVDYRTGDQVLSDIGALSSGDPTLDSVTTNGNTTSNDITVAQLSGSALNITGNSILSGQVKIPNTVNANEDTDKFLVLDSNGNVEYRTGAEVLSDIGAGGATLNLQDVTDNGNNTSNAISASALLIDEYAEITGDLVVGGSVTATEFYTTFVSSSVIYQSGSTQFGDSGDDTHDFTGVVRVTNIVSSSDSFIDDWGSVSASLATLQSSAGIATLQDVTDNGNVTTLSITASGANLSNVANAGADTDKFLVINSNGSVLFRTGDEIASDIGAATQSFDGSRPITQPLLPDLVNYNPGTSNIADFLEQVFYPDPGFGIEIYTNDPFSILESARSGSYIWANSVGFDNANPDPIAQFTANTDVSWSLQSNTLLYIHPNTGELSLKTDLSGSTVYTAPSSFAGTAIATATGGGYKTRDFTVSIIAQSPPQIVTTDYFSTVNNIFTTASGANLGYLTVQDIQRIPYGSASLIISGGADVDKFLFIEDDTLPGNFWTRYRVETTQALNSGSYTVALTASNGYGTMEYTTLTTVVEENTPPVVTQNVFLKDLAQTASGSLYGTITVTDSQQGSITPDSIKYPNINYSYIDRITSASLSGTDAGVFNFVPYASSSSPTNINYPYTVDYRVYFNQSAQAGTYNITASGYDQFGHVVSLPIVNEVQVAAPSVLQQNGTFRIIESAVIDDSVTIAASGIAGTPAYLYTNQPVSWSIDDPNNILAISGSNLGYLTLKDNISGSTFQEGSVLTAEVTATNAYDLSRSKEITVTVTDNSPAFVSLTNISNASVNNYYTTASNVAFGTVNVTDLQSIENVKLDSIGGPDADKFQSSSAAPAQSVQYAITSTQPLNSGSYIIDFTASDGYGQITTAGPVTLTVAPNNPPTITGAPFSKDYTEATNGDTIGTLQVADGDGGVDGIASFSLTGTDSSKFTAVLTGTAGNLTKSYNINATQDLAVGTYNISGSATDGFGHTVITPLATTITADAPNIPDSNAPFFAIESALAGASVTSDSSGIPGTVATFTTDQTVTWSLTNGIWLDINSSGELSLKINLSGSSKQAGAQINDEVVATNGAGTSSTLQFVVTVTNDQDPVITSGLITTKNNNKTTGSADFGTITISDPQSLGNVTLTDFNGPDVGSFSFNPGAVSSTTVYSVTSAGALNSGSYSFSVTGSDAYNQEAKAAFTITVTENLPPTLTQTGFTKTTGQAVNGATVGTIEAQDPQDDSIASFNLSGTDSSKFTAVLNSSTATSKLYNINTTQNLDPGTYNLTASATDSFGLSVTEPVPVTITAVAPDTPEKSHTQFYIIESATSSVAITGDSSGIPGSLARMTTDQSVSWSLTPPTYLTIDSDGYLSLQANVSGSAKTAGGEIVVTVRATNTFDSYSERVVDVDITANQAPTLSYTGLSVVSGSASANGETVGTVTATDPQAVDSISSIAITGGTDAASFSLASTATTANSRTYNINTAADLDAGTYQIELTATDSFNKQTVENKTITVTSPAASVEKIYIYGSTRASAVLSSANVANVLGDPGFDDVDVTAGSPLAKFKESLIGDLTIALAGGSTMYRIFTGSLAKLTDLDTFGDLDFSATLQQPLILFPSGSTIGDQPSSMLDGTFPASTGVDGRYVLYNNAPSQPGKFSAGVHYFDLDAGQSVDGFSRWGLIYGQAAFQINNPLHIIPDSGSAP